MTLNTITAPNLELSIRESEIAIPSSETVSIGNFAMDYEANLSGGGDLVVTKAFDWEGQSTMSGSGETTLGPSTVNVLNSGATTATLSERTLVNEGTFTQTSLSVLKLAGETTFRNKGTYNLNSEPYPTWIRDRIRYDEFPASGRLVNEGLFQRTEGEFDLEVTPLFENLGVLNPDSSAIQIKNPIAVGATERFGVRSCCGDPIETATGDSLETQTDLAIPGRGAGLVLTRSYSAQVAAAASAAGAFGYGWSASFSDHLLVEDEGETIVYVAGSGSTQTFTDEGGSFVGPPWSFDELEGDSESGYTLTLADQTELHFSSEGRLETATDRNGNQTTLGYDEAGRLEAITDPAERQITLAYDEAGQVETTEDPMGHVVAYGYEEGELTSVTMPGEEEPRWQFKYDDSHRITEMTDGRGGVTENEYDGSDRVISQTDPAGRTLELEYDSFNTTYTNKSTGSVTDLWFTSRNQPYSITRAYGSEDATTATFTYNQAGQVTSETDGNGHTTTYGYDGDGNRTSEKDPEGNEATWTHNETHDVLTSTTPGNETTTITRDAGGNPTKISRPAPGEANQITTFEYDEYGQLESVTDPLERSASFEYNSQGDLTGESDPLGNTRTFGYDEDSRLTSVVSPRGNAEGAEASEYTTSIEHDAQGRLVKVTDALGHETEFAYDGNGNLKTSTNAKGDTTTHTYNAADELTKTERPNGDVLETGYNGAGEIVSQTDGNEKTTEYVRDLLGQPIEVIDPLERKAISEFDPAGNLESVTDAAERVTSYTYDDANRLTEVTYSDETTPNEAVEYDADDNLVALSDGSGESSFEYDQLGRLTEVEDGHGAAVGYEYNLADEQTAVTYPNEKSISRAFDKAGRLESVTDWLEGTTSFEYDADSNLTAIAFPEGTGNVDEYSYDRIGRMEGAEFLAGEEPLASLSYLRDKLGQVEATESSGLPGPGELSFGYDKNERLIEAGEASFGYDKANNLTEAPGAVNSYDAASQLETGTGVAYAYNSLGERTKTTPEAGSATTYGYDQAGRLTSIERPEEGEVPAIEESFGYDGTGLMVSRTVGEATEYLDWDHTAGLPLLLRDTENSYVYGPGGLPIAQISSEGPTYLHHDQLGSTRMLTGSSGEVTATFSHTPYGALEGSTGSATTPLGFAGQYTEQLSGMQYLRARFYDPATGQFMTRDPIEMLTREPYSYTGGNPSNYTDPSGLEWRPWKKEFWTEGNPISESSLNPIPYYEKEIEAWQNGESYWNSVKHGLFGACVLVTDATGVGAVGRSVLGRGGVKIAEGAAGHIFRSAPGHLAADTVKNRALLQAAVRAENLVGTRAPGVAIYRETLPNGRQVWVEVYNGKITNGGVNALPR